MAKPSLDSLMRGASIDTEAPAKKKETPKTESASLSAAKRVLAAFESKDAVALDDALQGHYAACEEDIEYDEE